MNTIPELFVIKDDLFFLLFLLLTKHFSEQSMNNMLLTQDPFETGMKQHVL